MLAAQLSGMSAGDPARRFRAPWGRRDSRCFGVAGDRAAEEFEVTKQIMSLAAIYANGLERVVGKWPVETVRLNPIMDMPLDLGRELDRFVDKEAA